MKKANTSCDKDGGKQGKKWLSRIRKKLSIGIQIWIKKWKKPKKKEIEKVRSTYLANDFCKCFPRSFLILSIQISEISFNPKNIYIIDSCNLQTVVIEMKTNPSWIINEK